MLFPSMQVNELTFDTRDQFRGWLFSEQGRTALVQPNMSFSQGPQDHESPPIVWKQDKEYVGGCDALLALKAVIDQMAVATEAEAASTGARNRL
jgi:hypothetical protein